MALWLNNNINLKNNYFCNKFYLSRLMHAFKCVYADYIENILTSANDIDGSVQRVQGGEKH